MFQTFPNLKVWTSGFNTSDYLHIEFTDIYSCSIYHYIHMLHVFKYPNRLSRLYPVSYRKNNTFYSIDVFLTREQNSYAA